MLIRLFIKKKNIKNLVSLINYKSSKNIFYLLWFFINKYISITNYNGNIKYNKSLLFQSNYFVNLPIFLDTLNLLIIKYNLFYTKTADCTLDYENKKNSKLEKKLLITKIIYEKKNEKNKVLIKNDLKKKIKIYNIFLEIYIKITNDYKIIYDKFYKNSIKIFKNLFLINKLFYYRKKKI